MLKHFFTTTIRHFLNSKLQTCIAIAGLVLGWASFIAIGSYLHHELTYDQYHIKHERIYRVTHNEKAGDIPGTRHLPTVGPPMGPALKAEFPQVEESVRFRYHPDVIMRHDENQHYENKVYYADPSVFRVFDFTLSKGDAPTALSMPNNVVITQAIAEKYFGDEDPMGKIITMDREKELTVTGVFDPIPSNTHLQFDFLLPFDAFKVPFGYPVTLDSWGWISFHTYVLLKPGQSAASLEASLPGLIKKHWPEDRAKRFKIQLQPLSEIYLGDIPHEEVATGNRTSLIVLGAAGLLIMVIATFNFANIFTVITISRAKEVGVKKVLGASRSAIMGNLNGEAVIIMIGSLLFSILSMPAWSPLLPWQVSLNLSSEQLLFVTGGLLSIALLAGIVSGLYPSRLLASYKFQDLLKGSFRVGKTGIFIRKSLLSAQFIVSIALIICVLIISGQMDYLRTKDLGYAKNELMLLRMPGELLTQKYPQLRTKLEQNPHITSVSVGGGRMDGDTGNVPIYSPGATDEFGKPMAIDAITFDFFKTIGIKMLAGREFSNEQPADTLRGVIINEAAAKELGWTVQEALGKTIRIGEILHGGEVIGVVPDFNFNSLRVVITPLVMSYPRTRLQDIYVRFSGEDVSNVVSSVKSDWQQIVPDLPFDYVFLSAHLESLYRNDQIFAVMFRFFAVLAIVIACLGLYGLISQDVLYRMKEIGIRKVLGASVTQIAALVLKQFAFLLMIANIVAWPLGYFFMNQWLNEFSYHTSIHWSVFPLAGISVLGLALLSVFYNLHNAATMNPVESIRKD
jgi:putative ABC transport system permease protein